MSISEKLYRRRTLTPLFLVVAALCAVCADTASAQRVGPYEEAPTAVKILGISVEGAESDFTRTYVRQNSGLAEGQVVTIPGDPAIGDAIRAVYRLGLFSDVKVVEERRLEDGVYLAFVIKEEPKLASYSFVGVKKSTRKKLQKEVTLIPRTNIRPESIENAKRSIRAYYSEKGYPLVKIDVERSLNESTNSVDLTFKIDRGPKVRIGDIVIEGNDELSDRAVTKTMKTKDKRPLQFWRKTKFDKNRFEEDLDRIVKLYNERGYYGARITGDSVYIRNADEGNPEMVVEVDVEEGNKYYIRDIEWEGNTVYTDAQLEEALGLMEGEAYNGTRLEENLYGNKRSSDVASLYLNQGYMRFRVNPLIEVAGPDSLDMTFDVSEGDVYNFGTITISGNDVTKEHVIRRELFTIPGQTFSRDAIQESIRRLLQLNYFSQESLAGGPEVDVNDANKSVDLTYNVEEVGNSQLELSGTWGRFGLVLQLRFTFNNFSVQNLFNGEEWRPIPSGDGQQLSLGVQTNGSYYQNYSLSFSEPWFGGKPRQTGFALSYTSIGGGTFLGSSSTGGKLQTGSARIFYDQALKRPDRNFRTSTSIGYQYFNNDDYISSIRKGVSHQVTLRQSLSRNSTDHPIFPTSGSKLMISGEIAPPIGKLVQYHKYKFETQWNIPLAKKLSISVLADFGVLASLTGEPVEFERFVVGGSPFETSGFNASFGKDIVYMRGYPLSVIGPRQSNEAVGGLILNRYNSELRFMAIQSPQLQAAPYLFLDAANTWNGFSSYNPTSLFRSAGVGVRLFLPILGMVELAYGRNLDEYVPLTSSQTGEKKWLFQFTIGQGFGQ